MWASGNGGAEDDDCNCDGYVGMKEAISVGSITDRGLIPYFMEECPSTFAVVPSGGDTLEDIRLSDQRGNVAGNDKPKIKVVSELNRDCLLLNLKGCYCVFKHTILIASENCFKVGI